MKTRIFASYSFFLLLAFYGSCVQASSKCAATRLSDDDARILLYVSPLAESARKKGADVDIKDAAPSGKYPAPDYFVGAIVSKKFLSTAIVGNFVVDKRHGTVRALGNATEVKGIELMRIQNLMRLEHCIHGRKH